MRRGTTGDHVAALLDTNTIDSGTRRSATTEHIACMPIAHTEASGTHHGKSRPIIVRSHPGRWRAPSAGSPLDAERRRFRVPRPDLPNIHSVGRAVRCARTGATCFIGLL